MRAKPLALIFFLGLSSLACASVQQAGTPEQKNFNMHFYAPFLEPGLGGQAPTRGNEFVLDALQWTSATTGRLAGSLWQKKVVVEFTTSADRKTILDLRVDLLNNGLDVWRHRHSYIRVAGKGYVWNTLEDVRPPLPDAQGADYDAALHGAVRLWARRKVETILAGTSQSEAQADRGTLDKKMSIRYDKGGLIATASGDFFIRLWGSPVRVAFTIAPHTPTHDNPWIIQLARPIELRYERTEWQRRHGYRGVLGGYRWDSDFPDPKPAAGAYLDELLDRCAGYWSDAAVSIVMNGLDQQIKQAIGWKGVFVAGPPPNLKALTEMQLRGAWPQ